MLFFLFWTAVIEFLLIGSSHPQSNWEPFKSKSYTFQSSDEKLNFWNANNFCEKNFKSNLITITSNKIYEKFIEELKSKNISEAWIGLTDFGKEGQFYWISGHDSIKTNFWEEGYPRNARNSSDCVVTRLNNQGQYRWVDVHCAEIHDFVCMRMNKTDINVTNVLPPLSHYTNQCPKPYFPVDGDCFWITSENLTWNKSRNACQQKQDESDLATIRTLFQQEYFASLISGNASALWIGLNYYNNDYQWILQHGVTITNWGKNEPKIHQGECTYISGNEHQLGEWYIANCSKSMRAICQTLEKNNSLQNNYTNVVETDVIYDGILFQRGDCKPGYNYYHGSCYKLLTEKSVNYNEAQKLCKYESFVNKSNFSISVNLVNFDNSGEKYLILSNLRRSESNLTNNGLWLDIKAFKTENHDSFQIDLLNNSQVSAFEYAPNSMKKYNYICFKFLLNGIVNASSCDSLSTARTMCKYQLNLNLDDLNSNQLKASCPKNWVKFNSFCFYFEDVVYMSHYQARKKCMKLNSFLPSIDMNQQNFLKEYMTKRRERGLNMTDSWIGLEILKSSDSIIQYKWSNEKLMSYINLKNAEFVFQTKDKKKWCAVFSADNGVWKVVNCMGNPASLICQMEANITRVNELKSSTVSKIETSTKSYIDGSFVKPGFNIQYDKLNWKEALKKCKSQKVSAGYYSNLATFKLYSEILQLQKSNFNTPLNSQFWIGLSRLNDHFDNSFIRWSDKSSMVFQNFDFDNLINVTGSENCVVMDIISGKWFAVDCNEKRPFICRVSANKTENKNENFYKANAFLLNQKCPPKFFQHSNKCYRVVEEKKLNSSTAEAYCQKLVPSRYRNTTYLADIETTYENSFVYSLLSINMELSSDTRYWIGVRYRNDGDHQQLCSAISGHPDPYIGARWFTVNCSTSLKFICSTLINPKKSENLPRRKCVSHDYEYNSVMGTSCYNFIKNPSNLKEAVNRCELEKHKHHLLSIQSHYHMHFLRSAFELKGMSRDRSIWLGAKFEPSQFYHNWQWFNGQPIRYTFWNKMPNLGNIDGDLCMFLVLEKDTSGRFGMQIELCNKLRNQKYIICEQNLPRNDYNEMNPSHNCLLETLKTKYEGGKNTSVNDERCIRWDLLNQSLVSKNIIRSVRKDIYQHRFIQYHSNECRYIGALGLKTAFCAINADVSTENAFEPCNVEMCRNTSHVLRHELDFSEHHSNTLTVVLVTLLLFLCIIICIAMLSWRRWNKGTLFGGYLRRSQFSFLNNQSRGTSFHNPIYRPIDT